MTNHSVKLGEREVLNNGSVRYPIKVVHSTGETIIDTYYTVSKRQEKKLEKMVKSFAKRKIEEFETEEVDHSGKELNV